MLPPQLIDEVEELRKAGWQIDLFESDGLACMVFPDYQLPAAYNRNRTRLLLKFPMSYPSGKPDMFWTEKDVLLKDGRVPQKGDVMEMFRGEQWRRFSWHAQSWNPATDNLRTYLEFVARGLIAAAS